MATHPVGEYRRARRPGRSPEEIASPPGDLANREFCDSAGREDRLSCEVADSPPGVPRMSVTHYKRLHMEVDLRRRRWPSPPLPEGYAWASWHPVLLEAHARVKCDSFDGTIDAEVFESLSSLAGCQRLMVDIAHHEGFVPAATWLIRFEGNDFLGPTPVATIQGLRKNQWVGSIQNVGVLPEHRGCGLGRALLLQALAGYAALGMRFARLEVTAANRLAVRLYESLGFRVTRASYRTVTREAELLARL